MINVLNVLADKYLYEIEKFLPEETNLTLFDSNKPLDTIPEGTDALLIRTVTKINPQTFPDFPSSLQFVGTGSSGTDHVDLDHLKNNDIAFADAAGCNARSVAEYVAVALLLWSEQIDIELHDLSVGIVGAGHVGSEVQQILQKLQMNTVCYDPPRALREQDFTSASLKELLTCDILTFHTPLTHKTKYPTFHWLDEQKLDDRHFSMIINAARGGVIDEQALVQAFDNGGVDHFILDVWENEPRFNDKVARRAYIKTPHIAGYAVQAKQRASKIIADALSRHFSLKKARAEVGQDTPQMHPPSTFWSLTDALTWAHPIEDYKTRFMMLTGRSPSAKQAGFNKIRTGHPLRNEFNWIPLPEAAFEKYHQLQKLGFRLTD